MRTAGKICSRTMNAALAKLRPGTPQHEVIADVYQAQVLGLEGAYGDYTSLCPLIQVAEGTSTPHLTWTDAPLPESGLVVMELAGAHRHYHAPLTRTMHLGEPPAPMADLAKWQKILNKGGYRKDSWVGYSIGVNYPPDWGERTASLRPGDQTVLQAGMCFHFQSGVWLEDHGAAISESIIITDAGGERLCDGARELIVIN